MSITKSETGKKTGVSLRQTTTASPLERVPSVLRSDTEKISSMAFPRVVSYAVLAVTDDTESGLTLVIRFGQYRGATEQNIKAVQDSTIDEVKRIDPSLKMVMQHSALSTALKYVVEAGSITTVNTTLFINDYCSSGLAEKLLHEAGMKPVKGPESEIRIEPIERLART
jgi:hypothetical protein